MGKIVNINNYNKVEAVRIEKGLVEETEKMLLDTNTVINSKSTLSLPIAELSALGAGVSSLIPALNTATQTTTIASEGLYRLANADVGDTLKLAKNGNFWGAFNTSSGASKFAQLQTADPLSATTTIAVINPSIMLMAVALFSIEKELGNIAETGKQILSFLEVEKESEIEADVGTLMDIVTKYKFNWDNEYFVSSNHKLVLDIQRTARKNMNAYQKKINEVIKSKQLITTESKANSTLSNLEKKFKYYRLSLYIFSLATFMEIMLSGNFKEEYILGIKDEINEMSQTYRDVFENGSVFLEKMGSTTPLKANVVKRLGVASKTAGKFISNIPFVKDGQIDEFLRDKGDYLENNAIRMENKSVMAFAPISNPGTRMIIEKMQDMVRIYNHTSQIYFDKENIYLTSN